MSNVMTAPEPVQKERDHQDVMGRPHQQPMKGFLATLRQALRGVASHEDARCRTAPETAMDSLARQYPYLYIRTVCS